MAKNWQKMKKIFVPFAFNPFLTWVSDSKNPIFQRPGPSLFSSGISKLTEVFTFFNKVSLDSVI